MKIQLPLRREQRTLKNGMHVILIQKEGFAKSLFMLGIPAGGINITDQIGEQIVSHPHGCAHYLEHQMFRLNGQDVTYALAQAQAKTNAATGYDETSYFVWTNANPYEPLKLLIDFVQTLEITPETVEKERGIILSEYSQYDQEPESRLLIETFKSMYHNHPMREEILGTPEDISKISVEDLEQFYQTWYDPAQLVLVGVTGHDLDDLFDFIEQQEENYPSKVQHLAKRILPSEPCEVLQQSKTLHMDIDLPYTCVGVKLDVHAEDAWHYVRDDYMMNLWLNSRFESMNPEFQNWIDSHLIGGLCGAEADLAKDHGYILIYAQTNDPDRFIQVVKEELKAKTPISKEVFESLLIREKASSIRLCERFEALASQSVEGYFKGYDPLEDLNVLESIHLEDVNAFIQSLNMEQMSTTTILPLESLNQDEAND